MRTAYILHLQRVEQVFGLIEGRAGECVFLAVVEGNDDAVTAEGRVACCIIALDAQLAVLVLEHGVGIVEATVYQSDDDTLARICLWQVIQPLGFALMHFIYV